MRVLCCFILAGMALAQDKDPFEGTWVLDVKKSTGLDPKGQFTAGKRTYKPLPDGYEVVWSGTDAKLNDVRGGYKMSCKGDTCRSQNVQWTQKDSRTIDGVLLDGDRVKSEYVRTVSPDGKTLTIKFYERDGTAGKPKEISVQVWKKQNQ